MTFREKLLAAIDPDDFRENVSDSVLLDLVLDQLSATKAALKAAQTALITEGMRVDWEIENARIERQRMRTDPTYFASGDFFFHDPGQPGPFFVVDIVAGDVRLLRRQGNIDYALQPITRDTYMELLKKKGN